MFEGKIIWLALNDASGSNSAATQHALDEAFTAAGFTIARRIGFKSEGAPDLSELQRGNVEILVIFAGDGTVNAVISGLAGWDGTVLVLPGGTMNILARRLHGDGDASAIIARIAQGSGHKVRPTMVRSSYGDALSGVLAGPGTAWVEVREALRDTDVIAAVKGTAGAIGESTGGPKVVCREPACGRTEGYSAIQLTPGAEGLAVAGYYAETIGDYAKQGIALLRRNFRDGPHDVLGQHTSVRLACPEGEEMGLLIDGEPRVATSEETFTLVQCSVDLLATIDD